MKFGIFQDKNSELQRKLRNTGIEEHRSENNNNYNNNWREISEKKYWNRVTTFYKMYLELCKKYQKNAQRNRIKNDNKLLEFQTSEIIIE